MRVNATVYGHRPRKGETEPVREPTVGLTIEGTARLTISELSSLIDYLIAVDAHARRPQHYKMPVFTHGD